MWCGRWWCSVTMQDGLEVADDCAVRGGGWKVVEIREREREYKKSIVIIETMILGKIIYCDNRNNDFGLNQSQILLLWKIINYCLSQLCI